jgi:hypothetical protein
LLLQGRALAEEVPPPTVEATADAHYQSVTTGPDSESQIGVAGGPSISAEARSLQAVDGIAFPPDIYAWDDSDGRARASLPGTLGAYARAGGFSPGFGTLGAGTFATATARKVTNWEVAGPAGGTTPIDVDVALDGLLYADEYAGIPSGPVAAEVSLQINLITAENTINLLQASGRVDLFNGAGFSGYFSSLDDGSSFPWFGSFVPAGPYGLLYQVDYSEAFEDLFVVNNNETFAFETILTTTADNQWGPFEVFATSDFFNTGDVQLSVDTPGAALVNHNPIPEPSAATCTLIGTMLISAMVLSRRQRA